MADETLTTRAMTMLSQAVERALADERRAAKVAKAVGAVQRSRENLDKAQESLMKAVGMPSKSDYKDVSKRIAALKRRVRQVAERLEKQKPE